MTPVYIHALETLTPPHRYAQAFARDRMRGWLQTAHARRLAGVLYDRSGIETRYSVLPDFMPGATPLLFHDAPDGTLAEPGTGARNRVYAEASRELSVAVARRLLDANPHLRAETITHVITVSCTGFYNPGPDYDLVRGLGLNPSVERYHLGFMGCYAALPALKLARQCCQADPAAVVLVVSLELCSVHLQIHEAADSVMANALFSDGAAAAVVSASAPAPDRPALCLEAFHAEVLADGLHDMTWEIGDRGFDIRLSSYVPALIGSHIAALVARLLARAGVVPEAVGRWAVHPGGRAILDKVERELGLQPEQLAASREVLRHYGNMSSATLLFVLQAILREADAPVDAPAVCAMAFGPGLTIESALLRRIAPGRAAAEGTP